VVGLQYEVLLSTPSTEVLVYLAFRVCGLLVPRPITLYFCVCSLDV
jgi:hypothetical protein